MCTSKKDSPLSNLSPILSWLETCLRECTFPPVISFAPTSLAQDWDNVGLLVEPTPPHRVNKLLLTNDLTEAVLEEALSQQVNREVSSVQNTLSQPSFQMWTEIARLRTSQSDTESNIWCLFFLTRWS